MSDESNGVLRDAAADELCSRIIAYLAGGGLINPEMANHDAVRDLLIDARAEVMRLRAAATLTDAERDDIAMWMDVCARQRSGAIDGGCDELAERWGDREERARRLMARLGGER